MQLRSYQHEAVESVFREWGSGNRRTLLTMATGCHAPSQLILMSDGTVKHAGSIVVGDKLMGPDGKPRHVIALHSGETEMMRVVPVKGSPFIVTHDHLLALTQTSKSSNPTCPSQQAGRISVIPTDAFYAKSKTFRHINKLFRSDAIEVFEGNDGSQATIDPYFVGVLLGDGETAYSNVNVTTMDAEVVAEIERQAEKYGASLRSEQSGKANTYFFRSGLVGRSAHGGLNDDLKAIGLYGKKAGDKSVPHYYKTLPIKQRLEVIAGLIDTDGCLVEPCGYDFISKSQDLSEDLAFMCRSVGLAAYVSETKKSAGDFTGTYWRVSISGDCSMIPCRVARRKANARKQKKNVLRTGIKSIDALGLGAYNGFTVDGDNLYLMGDFTVTHNCGKTVVFATIAGRIAAHGGRTLVLAHRGELLEQARDKVRAVTGLECSLEKAESTSLGTWERVTVGSVQTLMREDRLSRFDPDRFEAVIVDEAHHAASDSYRRIIDHFTGANVLGVTATPDRADRKNLGTVFDSLAYEYDLAHAVKDGYLCPIQAQTIPLSIDISHVSTQSGDYATGELGDALEPYLDAIADEMVAAGCAERRTVVFLPLVRTAKHFAEILSSKGLRATEVDGMSEDREQVLSDFDAGRYDVLCNSMLLTEGWDCPAVDCVVVLRATKSRSLYCQMIGRGTRLSPGKDHLLLLDFLWMTCRHELCRPASIVAKTEEVAAKMTDALAEAGGPMELFEVEDQAERDVQHERESALARELEAQRHKRAKLVDPLQYEMSIADFDLQNYVPEFAWQYQQPTDRQRATLEKFGINAEGMDAGKASLMLDRLVKRKEMGLATPKQIRFLERKGFVHVGEWEFAQASAMITRISKNGWRVPTGVVPEKYVPGKKAKEDQCP